jgi:hypothetical protein
VREETTWSLSRFKFWRGIKFEPARLLLVFGLLRRVGPKPNPALGREALKLIPGGDPVG